MSQDLQSEYGHLRLGVTYEVIQSFRDYQNFPYAIGDLLVFEGSSFVPYESGLSLHFDKQGSKRQCMLCVREGFHKHIANNLSEYFSEVAAPI